MRYAACLVVVLFIAMAPCVAVAQTMAGSIFDLDWGKKHPPKPEAPAPPQAEPKVQVETGPVPASQPSAAVATVVQPISKASIPDAASQMETEKIVREVFESDIAGAKEPEQRSALAKKLLQTGIETRHDLTARFVLCRMARDIASESGDAETAFGAVDAAGEMHQIDALALSVDVARKLMRATNLSNDATALVVHLDGLVDEAIAEDRLDVARQLCDLMMGAASRTNDDDLEKQVAIRSREIKGIEASYGQTEKRALATLTTQPADPGANLVAGKYQCFVSGNWEAGLRQFALGNDAKLKELAQKELAHPTEPDGQVEIANKWWEIANNEKGIAARHIQLHASTWYQKALPEMTELKKAVIEKRLKMVEAAASGLHPAARKQASRIIDLLGAIDVQRDAVKGTWMRTAQGIQSDANQFSRLRIAYQPPQEYDYHIEFTRLSGNQSVTMMLPTCLFGICMYDRGDIAGFDKVKGQATPANPTGVASPIVQNNRRYSMTVQVRKDHIAGFFDGKLVTQYSTDGSDLSMNGMYAVGANALGVGSFESPTIFHVIEVIEITGEGKVLAGN